MKVKISAGLHNGAIQGNTMNKVVVIDNEDLEGLTVEERNTEINRQVFEVVLDEMVDYDWEEWA